MKTASIFGFDLELFHLPIPIKFMTIINLPTMSGTLTTTNTNKKSIEKLSIPRIS